MWQLSPDWSQDLSLIYLGCADFQFCDFLTFFRRFFTQQRPPLLPVKLLLRPSFSHTPVGLGDIKETPFCNVTEDVSPSEPKKGLNSLLETVSPFQMILVASRRKKSSKFQIKSVCLRSTPERNPLPCVWA